MSRLGMADMGLATMNDMRDNAAMIANIVPSVPLIADADTGYGGKSSHISTQLYILLRP
jgi:2-methylisocitrate lyase-like PEP mutase family enzyme